MTKAVWNQEVIAESQDTVVIDGNHYFPPSSLKREFVEASETTSVCSWKGSAHYYSLKVNGETNPDAAWYYPAPKAAAAELQDHVAFWRGVDIMDS
jgi:uncharacterized protein (DUF427 family)